MAMYVETTREGRPPDATTLEEAAEELLNGLLCHYEPPDTRSVSMKMRQENGINKKGGSNKKGILRASSKMFRKGKNKKRSKSVRWKDEQNTRRTPDIYDIGKGCREALTECGSTDADSILDRETEKLAELSQQRAPKPISKRIRTPDSDDTEETNDTDRYSGKNLNSSRYSAHDSTHKNINDPISAYRKATQSPKVETVETTSDTLNDIPDDGSILFDDQGNVVGEKEEVSVSGSTSNFGPPKSPVAPQKMAQTETRKPRQQTPYKQRREEPPVHGRDTSALCGIMCDPKFLNCEILDSDYPGEQFDGYGYPPPPPPPLPLPSSHFYRYEEPNNSLISGSEGEDEEEDVVATPTKKGFRDRLRRKSKKRSSSADPSDERKLSGQKGRGRSRSPGRRGRAPSRSKSPGRKKRQDKKFPMSPLSFITGNRSFSRSPRSKAAREVEASESEANFSVQSVGSSTVTKRKTSKSPSRRKWFGRGRKSNNDKSQLQYTESTPTNSDWDYPGKFAQMNHSSAMFGDGQGASRGRSHERPDQLSTSRSRSYDRLDPVDRSRLSDFEAQDHMLRSTRSRSLDRQDYRGQQRLASYERAESHIGLSRISFDDEEMLQRTRSRSLERPEQLRPARSRSLERRDIPIHATRSRSLDRHAVEPNPGYDPRLVHLSRNRSMEKGDSYVPNHTQSFERHMDPRRSSYPSVQPPPVPQQPHFWQNAPQPGTNYHDQHYHNFMAQRPPAYPPHGAPGSLDPTPRQSCEHSEPRNRNQSWWGGRRNRAMEQERKSAAEPPAAVYSHEPHQQTRPVQMQHNSIYSHDPRSARSFAPPTVIGRAMPPTPTQREGVRPHYYDSHQSQYVDAQPLQYVEGQPMPPTPTQRTAMFQPDNHAQINQSSQQQHKQNEQRRDPTPRNGLLDLMLAPLQSQQPVRPPSPPRPFSVAEQIHRVSWGEPPRRETDASNATNQSRSLSAPAPAITNVSISGQRGPVASQQGYHGIPSTLPGKEKAAPPPPPPPHAAYKAAPPPPPPPLPPSQPKQNLPSLSKRPSPSIPSAMASGKIPVQNNVSFAVTSQTQFKDLVDENKPHPSSAGKKDGKGRKLLGGIFSRGKRKQKQQSNMNRYEVGGEEEMEIDGSIISDAILKDRHDRFVTKL